MILIVLPEGGYLANLEHPAEIWWGQIADTAGRGETGEETVEDRKTTDLPIMPMRNALVSTPAQRGDQYSIRLRMKAL